MIDRAINDEEKIRHAEEIYYRRRNPELNKENYTSLNINEKKNYSLLKKMFVQIVICLIIYFAFYIVQNRNYIFSEALLNKTDEILSYDINFENLKQFLQNYYNKFNTLVPSYDANLIKNNQITENTQIENVQTENSISDDINNSTYIEDASSVMETNDDNKNVNDNSFIKPLSGTITSRFGNRNPSSPNVPKYHTGIDISANIGTKIVAAMDGKATQVSDEGDYGKHLRIEKGDITTLYAHCNKIYIKDGDNIKQGEEIAEVGQTGNATGPHLHFEIRKGDEFLDPETLINFN